MAIDLQKLEQKFDALFNDPNFVTDFEQWLEARKSSQHAAKLPVMRRFRVNMLHRGKERWKYCRTIERAKRLQQEATAGGLCSIIFEKIDGSYVAWNGV